MLKSKEPKNKVSIDSKNVDLTDFGQPEYVSPYSKNKDIDFDPSKIKLKTWHPSMYKPSQSAIMYGMRKSGKSFAMKAVMHHHRNNFHAARVWSKSELCNGFYHKDCKIPTSFVANKVEEEDLEKLTKFMEDKMNHAERAKKKPPHLMVVFDDFAGDHSMRHTEDIMNFYLLGRHRNTSPFVLTQHPTLIPPAMRNNADWAFIFRLPGRTQLESLGTSYSVFDDKNHFKKFVDHCTRDFHCLVVDTFNPTLNPEEKYFIWKAPEIDNFDGFGDKEFRNHYKSSADKHDMTSQLGEWYDPNFLKGFLRSKGLQL